MPTFEQEYYEYDNFWNPKGTPLGEIDKKRVLSIYKMLPPEVRSILDVGCGNGIFCNFIKQQNSSVRIVGFDRSNAALKYVMTEKVVGEISEIPYSDREFDCITALEVLEHLPNKVFIKSKQEISRVACKYIIVSVPYNQSLGSGMTQCPSCKTKFDPDLHMRSFNFNTMRTLFSDYGFTCKKIQLTGHFKTYAGMEFLRKISQVRHRSETMLSPICPLCGFTNDSYLTSSNLLEQVVTPRKEKTASQIPKSIIKKVWPKIHKSRWIVGLYTRI